MAAFDKYLLDYAKDKSSFGNGRYAPSPTGYLHLGNLSTAWQAYLHSKKKQQPLILRIEDIDETRAIAEREIDIISDLKALGVDWQYGPGTKDKFAPYHQSKRQHYYQIAFDYLLTNKFIYPCYCSRKEVQQQQDIDNINVYPGTCRPNKAKKTQLNSQSDHDKTPCWRFVSSNEDISFFDHYIKKDFTFNASNHGGDFIIKRSDGFFAYQLAVVVDDILMQVGDVVRGQDLLDNTPWQIMLYKALGHADLVPNYYHVPLLMNAAGEKLSKRNKDNGLSFWLAKGYSIKQIIAFLEEFQLPPTA